MDELHTMKDRSIAGDLERSPGARRLPAKSVRVTEETEKELRRLCDGGLPIGRLRDIVLDLLDHAEDLPSRLEVDHVRLQVKDLERRVRDAEEDIASALARRDLDDLESIPDQKPRPQLLAPRRPKA
jgi:hypothetical protein